MGRIPSKFVHKAVRDSKTRQHLIRSDYVDNSDLARRMSELERETRKGKICPECKEPLRPEDYARVKMGEDLACGHCGAVITDSRSIMRTHRGITKGRGR